MKLRIVTDQYGNFFVQEKSLWFWTNLTQAEHFDGCMVDQTVQFRNFQDAEDFIKIRMRPKPKREKIQLLVCREYKS